MAIDEKALAKKRKAVQAECDDNVPKQKILKTNLNGIRLIQNNSAVSVEASQLTKSFYNF